MTDPSIDAAKQVWERHEPPYISDDLVAAAREALKPIREWYHKAMACEANANDLAPLIFTTEEMNQ